MPHIYITYLNGRCEFGNAFENINYMNKREI